MRDPKSFAGSVTFLTVLAALVGVALWGGADAAPPDSTKAPAKATTHGKPPNPGQSPAATTAAPRDPRITELTTQIETLRQQYHAQLDPLEGQVKALREKFEPQIDTLEAQRHAIVEAGKSPEMQAIDNQEAAELKSLADQEKAEIDKVRQHYADMRKEVQARYQKRRQDLHGGK